MGSPNAHGDRGIFSDNWPNLAHQWLPIIDHPYDKATSEFIITAPSKYQVAANGLLQEDRCSATAAPYALETVRVHRFVA